MRIFFALLALALGLAGCSSTGQLTGSANTDITNALAIGCPILAAAQAQVATDGIKLTQAQQGAVTSLALACPPNPPPTSGVVAAVDLIQAYTVLKPLIKK